MNYNQYSRILKDAALANGDVLTDEDVSEIIDDFNSFICIDKFRMIYLILDKIR